MKQVHSTVPCGDISLEAVWHFPEADSPMPAVVVCHPHPLHGGNMANSVVVAICQALAQQSIAALRFNFRGVGRSGGKHGGGVDEQEDVSAALALVSSTAAIDPGRVGLAGYSFGTSVALPVAAQNDKIRLLALVSPALSDAGWEQLKVYPDPVFLICGETDFVIPVEKLQQHLKDSPKMKDCEVVLGADHFWQGYEAEVGSKVAEFFADGFRRL